MRSTQLTIAAITFGLFLPLAHAETCNQQTGEAQLLFGDLHVHTAFSLDAYAFGTLTTPRDAYEFARGQPLRLDNGQIIALDRPLDFAAVTDHAETWEVTWSCTDPAYEDIPYCEGMRRERAAGNGRGIFTDYLLPVVTQEPPVHAPFCDELDCEGATRSQWRRVQEAANQANDPCEFTALIGYEWTASPNGRHWHRNVIFRSELVPERPFDYITYPSIDRLWTALAEACRPEEGCDAVAIPHNINWTDGGTFDVENDSREVAALRSRYERLTEMHQEKGNSECLPETHDADQSDCGFELVTVNGAKVRMLGPAEDPVAEWRAMRSGYYRTLLSRGLVEYERTRLNPLQLGAIGSTDGHFAAAGFTEESSFPGGVTAIWLGPEATLANPLYNPGGLVAVWAEANTRAGVFDALRDRRAYATSGTRIRLRFGTTGPNACSADEISFHTRMGGTAGASELTFTVQVAMDRTPLAAVDIVKGYLDEGEAVERVVRVAEFETGQQTACITWTDESRDAGPAYWYARVTEQPSKRWSKHLCERLDLCEKFPQADRMIEERAWSSPIWRLPQ